MSGFKGEYFKAIAETALHDRPPLCKGICETLHSCWLSSAPEQVSLPLHGLHERLLVRRLG
jgi:hypothetical protein